MGQVRIHHLKIVLKEFYSVLSRLVVKSSKFKYSLGETKRSFYKAAMQLAKLVSSLLKRSPFNCLCVNVSCLIITVWSAGSMPAISTSQV